MPKKPDQRPPTAREILAEQSNMTHAQLAVWGSRKHASAPGRFNRVLIFDLEGRMDGSAFQRAFRALVQSHDAMRLTVDEQQDGIPRWDLLPLVDGGLSLLDFSADNDPEQTLSQWLRERCACGFEPGQPLFHSALVRLGEKHHVWYLNQHQLITDGVSTALLCRRMAELYALAIAGPIDPLPVYPRFQEYVNFERRNRQAPVYAHTRAYWEAKLAKPPAALSFFGRVGKQPDTDAGGPPQRQRVVVDLGPERSIAMRELCRIPGHFLNSLEFSQFMAFTTLLFAYLQRATGESQLRIGAPFHNRIQGGFEQTVGLLSETCPVQMEVTTTESLQTLLNAVMKEVRSVLMHAQPGASCAVADHPCSISVDYLGMGCNRFRGITSRIRQVNTQCGNPGTLMHMQVLDFAACDSISVQFMLDPDAFGSRERALLAPHFLALVDAFLTDRDTSLSDIALPLAVQAGLSSEEAASAPPRYQELSEEPLIDA